MIGLPDWSTADILKDPKVKGILAIAEKDLQGLPKVERWTKRDGNLMHIMDIWFPSAKERSQACKAAKDDRLTVGDKQVFINPMQGEIFNLVDKPVREALKRIKKAWQGLDPKTWRILWKERTLTMQGEVVMRQDMDTLELQWIVPENLCCTEVAVKKFLCENS